MRSDFDAWWKTAKLNFHPSAREYAEKLCWASWQANTLH